MEIFNREDWIKNDCVYTNDPNCAACPYVVGDENGYFKCDKKMHAKCQLDMALPQKEDNPDGLPTRDAYFAGKEGIDSMWSDPLYICPKCGGKVRKDLSIVLTTYPPKYRYECERSDCDYMEVM